MLSDMINAYVEAQKKGNTKEMQRIEKQLAKLGMDRMTLQILAKEVSKNVCSNNGE